MDKYRSSGQPGVIEFANMFQFQSDFEEQFVACRNVNRAKELFSKLQDFKTRLTSSTFCSEQTTEEDGGQQTRTNSDPNTCVDQAAFFAVAASAGGGGT
jgi:hypothetical protein